MPELRNDDDAAPEAVGSSLVSSHHPDSTSIFSAWSLRDLLKLQNIVYVMLDNRKKLAMYRRGAEAIIGTSLHPALTRDNQYLRCSYTALKILDAALQYAVEENLFQVLYNTKNETRVSEDQALLILRAYKLRFQDYIDAAMDGHATAPPPGVEELLAQVAQVPGVMASRTEESACISEEYFLVLLSRTIDDLEEYWHGCSMSATTSSTKELATELGKRARLDETKPGCHLSHPATGRGSRRKRIRVI